MLRLIVAAFLMLQLQVQAKEYYSIIGPGTIRPNTNYSIVVTVYDLKQACKIKLGVEGPQFDKKIEVIVPPMSVEKVDLWIPDIVKGSYSLIAEGISGFIFKNSTILNFVDGYSPAIYVQTDKAMYKPGDLLQFRVILLDANLKPAVIKKPIVINVENAEKIRIKQFTNITLVKGVFKQQVQLSEFTKVGNWNITVQINGEVVQNKVFTVEKYELPKFLVEIDAPKQIGITEDHLRFTIRSTYTYGKPVKGTATINIFRSYTMTNLYSMIEEVQGKKQIELDFEALLPNGVANNFKETLLIEVKVSDKLTGIKRNSSIEIDVMQFPTLIKTPKTLAECEMPEDVFEYPISVTNLNFQHVVDKKKKKKIRIIQKDEKHGEETISKTLNDKGETSVLLKCSMANTINFEIEYEGNKVYRELSRTNFVEEDKVGVHVKTLGPKVGKPMNVHLKSDVPFTEFIYVITAGGNIVASDIIQTEDEEIQSHVFQITPTFEMIPEAYIYVYFVEHNNYIFYETSFKLPRQFQNKLTIRAPKQTIPAEEIQLKIKTDINSYVGLLAVDKSVLLLKSGNDLNAIEILQDSRSFTSQIPDMYLDTKDPYPGEESGLVTLTDAHFRFTYQKENKEKIDPYVFKRSITPLRAKFPETWFFDDFESTNKGGPALNKIVPDTITTWVVTGFSLNTETGLALIETPVEILTFIKFFITTNLPYSIKRGEAISIPVVVYNYMKDDLQVGITLNKNDDDFEFINEDEASAPVLTFVPANDGITVHFVIRPKRIGYITLKITGESVVYIDTIEQRLKVEPEGLTVFKNHEFLVRAGENRKVKIDIPDGRVPDSEHVEVATTQYILGSMISTIANPDALENLIRKPVGCGEQNMIYLVPNIMVLDYLKSIGKLTQKIEKAAKNFIEVGYQNELNYRHNDGSFSTWKSDAQGSTWLTAYVMRSFQQASKYVTIDSKILEEGFSFLAKKQNAEGRFVEDGHLTDLTYHNNIVITAFVLLAFLEDQKLANKYSDVINRGYQYLENNIKNANADMYSLSITAYVLQIRKPDIVKGMLPTLEAKAKLENQLKWWTKEADIKTWISPATHDNEVTSYILMALLDMNEHVEPTLKWLISKRNSNGGFASTQETAVGLAALAKFSSKNTAENANLIIDIVDASNSAPQGMFTTSTNVEMQQLVLDNKIRDIELKARGLGNAVLQVSYRYNILQDVADQGFKIDVEQIESGSKLHMRINFELTVLDIDIRIGDDANDIRTSMVLMEVHLPTGYAADVEYLTEKVVVDEIDHVELQNADSKINIYFESLNAFQKIQIPIKAVRMHAVAELKPSPIIVYDYVDSSKRGTHYYQISSPLCDLCDEEQCFPGCEEDE